ncbi:TonB family protein [Roseivirga sp. BDSF3-8]|uniref:TonB family protein n=1 Tax=Roseivirga sp. BDSF3-8 TaxID=3241598 RepID=UPI0035325144
MEYPENAKRLGIVGRIYVQFVVDKEGDITEVKVLKGIGAACDSVAAKVVRNAPNWKPGKHEGKVVKVRMVLPIVFSLHGVPDKKVYIGIKPADWEKFTVLHKKPILKKGMPQLTTYLNENFNYPEAALKDSIQGAVSVRFTVSEEGKVSHITPLTEKGYGCEEELVRLVENMPEWKPGKDYSGYKIDTDLILTVYFRLEEQDLTL